MCPRLPASAHICPSWLDCIQECKAEGAGTEKFYTRTNQVESPPKYKFPVDRVIVMANLVSAWCAGVPLELQATFRTRAGCLGASLRLSRGFVQPAGQFLAVSEAHDAKVSWSEAHGTLAARGAARLVSNKFFMTSKRVSSRDIEKFGRASETRNLSLVVMVISSMSGDNIPCAAQSIEGETPV